MKNIIALDNRLKRLACSALAAACLAVFPGTGMPTAHAVDYWTLEREAGQDEENGNLHAAAPKWKLLVEHYLAEGNAVNAALYAKNLGKYYDGQKEYETAIYYYELENENWLKAGYDWGAEDLFRAPVDRLEELYRLYADRKPVMISETAVTHATAIDGQAWTDWGVMNLERLYEVMTKEYPRLKAITYFNRGLNQPSVTDNFLLRENSAMMDAYKRIIASPHFLTKVENGAKPAVAGGYAAANGSARFAGKTVIYPYIKIPDIYNGKVEYRLNGSLLKTELPPYEGVELKAGGIVPGSVLEVKAYNQAGAPAVTRQLALEPQITVKLNGRSVSFEEPPVNWEGNVLVPMRAVFEALGAEVSWNPETRTATGRKGGKTASVTIDSISALQNGKTFQLEAAPRLVNGYTMVPARFIAESFGSAVDWDGEISTVLITQP